MPASGSTFRTSSRIGEICALSVSVIASVTRTAPSAVAKVVSSTFEPSR